jgi:hypothetical protein
MSAQFPQAGLNKRAVRNLRMRNDKIRLPDGFLSVQQNIKIDLPWSPTLRADASQALLNLYSSLM